MSKKLSFYALLGVVALVSALFYRVVQPFAVALFIAVVLAVLVEPLFERLTYFLKGHRRLAAALTTLCVVALLIVPTGCVLLMASSQLANAAEYAVEWFDQLEGEQLEEKLESLDAPIIGQRLERAYRSFSAPQRLQMKQAAAQLSSGAVDDL